MHERKDASRAPSRSVEPTDVARQIRNAMLSARRAPPIVKALPPLTDSDFDKLAQASACDEAVSPAIEQMPRISGYAVEGEISRGGQAAVYRATQESTGKQVAVKVMVGGAFASSRHRTRFEREANILGSLDHPNVVGILERGRTSDGSFFIVMPFIRGQTLDEYWLSIARNAEGLRSIAAVFVKIASAVEEAHARGVVHRDLKPSNILVDRREEPHILDFGLARPVDDAMDVAARTITVPGQIIGSLPWASPEQAAGNARDLDAPSDVYSLGVILFQALTGAFPYSLEGPIDEVLQRIRLARVTAPSKQPRPRPGIDWRMDVIVLKALSKEPAARYASAGGLASDLRNWLSHEPLVAARRKRIGASNIRRAAAGTLAASCLIAAVAWMMRWPSQAAAIQLPTTTNSIGMVLVKIPAGILAMGSAENEEGRTPDEHPHRVRIEHDFWMGRTVVTQAEYEKVVHYNPSDPSWINPNMPVQEVSWKEAADYCEKLSELEKSHYRLPSEAEWEYACRANSPLSFPDPIHPGATAYTKENSGGTLHIVATKLPNAWGLFDMQGNVRQWCADLYTQSANTSGTDVARSAGRAVRGGSFTLPKIDCRAASRSAAPQAYRSFDLGFRVVRDP